MVRMLRIAGCSVVLGLGAAVGAAWGQGPGCNSPNFPANSAAACGAIDGTFDPGPPQTCTDVNPVGKLTTAAAPGCNKPSLNAGFTGQYEIDQVTVYTKDNQGSCSVVTTTNTTLVACYNSQDKPTSLEPCICPNGKDKKD